MSGTCTCITWSPGNILTLTCGMMELAFQPGDFGVDLLSIGFGVGAAFVLDEFALTVHLRDVYWTPEGRHSIEVSIIWTLLGLILLTGVSPFGIHDQTETPRIIGFAVVIDQHRPVDHHLHERQADDGPGEHLPAADRTRGRDSARPAGLDLGAALLRPGAARPGAGTVRSPLSRLEALRRRFTDLLGGSHDLPPPELP